MKEGFDKQVKYWEESSKKDFGIALLLFERKYYAQSLFFCHLSVEKLLKARVMEKLHDYAPYTHDLVRLAEIAEIKFDTTKKKSLEDMFSFNVAGRYEDAKLDFHKKYNNREIVKKWISNTEDLLTWLKEKSQKE
jgi:HEPN domain-containing protein